LVSSFEWGRSRFLQEASTLARFRHPSVVQVTRVFGTKVAIKEYYPEEFGYRDAQSERAAEVRTTHKNLPGRKAPGSRCCAPLGRERC
jgi:hypothetical protein